MVLSAVRTINTSFDSIEERKEGRKEGLSDYCNRDKGPGNESSECVNVCTTVGRLAWYLLYSIDARRVLTQCVGCAQLVSQVLLALDEV